MLIKSIIKFILKLFLLFVVILVLLFGYFNFPVSTQNNKAEMGVTFSHRYAGDIGLNWKETLAAVLDDLKVRNIRIPVYWDLVESMEGEYDFSDVDWQLDEINKRNGKVVLVIGQKVPRWPECAIPEWAKSDDEKRKKKLLEFISLAVDRYKKNSEIAYWQVENEPFLRFGICPSFDVDLLDKELALVREKDSSRPIIVTDSGELSLWVRAASRADMFGTTMYRTIWKEGVGLVTYPIGPRFFHFKSFLVRLLTSQRNISTIELQAEPWIAGWTTSASLEEQFKSMNPKILKENVEFAKKAGFSPIYLWGAEWWYWLKVEKNHPEVWDEAGTFFRK